ncbi:probable DNA-(apurinic or apyrimidinic site) lyase 1 [Saccharomycodes ludwigii]|uniref:Apurinic-apyrimidinic endonuclease 1 n=1 Tax=Saccharomycodes ludwigii TaxID=36035 RepID=A0A376B4Z6_9ASCO|nr:probable DNA-(apurinic or apyrimidinic site) lyase 1 [Saccharomycodes ludwigii]
MPKASSTKTAIKFTRSTTSKFKFGAHVSASGGISKSVTNAFNIGCNSFAMFLKSPRKWSAPPFTTEEINKFRQNCIELKYDPLTDILPHGQYMINLANPDKEKAEKSFESFLDELRRCEELGIGHYNFHPGSSLSSGDHEKQLKQLANYINIAHEKTSFVKTVIENMAGTGNLVGSDLNDIRKVIELVKNKDRVGVCIDTCHTFAAGYDIGTEQSFYNFMNEFDQIIGQEYLMGIHLNDSKAPLGGNRDLHEKIGQGYIGLEVFKAVAHCDLLCGIPIILETPQEKDEGYGEEIKLLEWLEEIGDKPEEGMEEENEKDNKLLQDKIVYLQKLGENSRKKQMELFEKKKNGKDNKAKKKRSNNDDDIITKLAKKVKR